MSPTPLPLRQNNTKPSTDTPPSHSYVGIPIYFGFYAFWKILKRPKFVKPHEADIWSGKVAIDAEIWPERIPRNFVEKFWFWLA